MFTYTRCTLHAARTHRDVLSFSFSVVGVFSCVCVLQLCGGRDLMLDDKGKLLEHISASHMSCSTSHMHMHMHMSIYTHGMPLLPEILARR